MAGAPFTSLLPAEIGEAIRTVKAQLRSQIGDVAAVFSEVEEATRAEAASVAAARAAGRPVWPVVRFADIAAGTVPTATMDGIRRRGCAIVQGTFSRQRAEGWDAALASYVDRNGFAETYRPVDDGVFWPRGDLLFTRSTGPSLRSRRARTTTWSRSGGS